MSKQVLILLAAYKGGAYIREMVDSILQQDWEDWFLILSDDGTDTAPILQEYADRYPDRIRHHRSGQRFGCAQKHFMYLLRTFGDQAPYCMFCDQDDVWHPDKVRKTLEAMQKAETDAAQPVLVHTDLNVVDGALKQIAPSFLDYSGLKGDRLRLNQLLMQNVVTGCTAMINRSLAQLASREVSEDGMLMHDWWLALLAAAKGSCVFLNEATIDYRQHGSNSVGAKNTRSVGYILGRMRSGIRRSMEDTSCQAAALLAAYPELFTGKQREMLEDFSCIFQKKKLQRIGCYLRHRLWKVGLTRKIAQIIWG